MKNSTKKTVKNFTRLVAMVISVGICLGVISGCNNNSTSNNGTSTSASQFYDPTAGIDFEKTIGSLAYNGASGYKIVVPTEPHPAEEYAASELQKYVKQSTGAMISIVADDSGVALGESLICIGGTKFVNEIGLETKNLNVDGFKIKTNGKTVLIKGEIERGTLYGVYHFLETLLGIRFLTPDSEYVPQLASVSLYEMDVTEIPAFQILYHQKHFLLTISVQHTLT